MDVKELIKSGENKTLEFKEQFPTKDQIIRTIVAFSNTAGGKIFIGVNDKREIIGLEDKDIFELQDRIVSLIYETCYPNILPEIYIKNIDGKIILVIEIYRGSTKPYFIKNEGIENGVYLRIGATNRKASLENIQELKRQNLGLCYDEEIDYTVDFKDIDISVLENKFKNIGKSFNISKMKGLKLVKEESGKIYPTRALSIILGLHDHVETQCANFKGNTPEIFIDKKEFSGNLFEQLNEIEKFIKNNLFLRGEIKGLQRTDTYELPLESIREAIINAIIHRDYSNRGRNLKVAIFEDVLEILSPGGLPYSITLDEAFTGRSEARNKSITRIFRELGYVEQWGTGLIKIKKQCLALNLKEPLISERGDFFSVIFYRNKSERTNERTDERTNIVFYQYEIKEYLRKNNQMSTSEAQKLLNLGKTRISEILKIMIESETIKRTGTGKNTRYTL
ncbi:MAG: RNA-binding domain-containing protein [Fusobacteriaceae bacterium]